LAASALAFALLSGYNSILNGIQGAARQRSIVALHQGMESWARYLMAAGLMVLLGATSVVAMVGYSVAIVLVLSSQYAYFRKIVPSYITGTDKERIWREQLWKFSWPISFFGIFTWVYLASDRWALQFYATTQDVGLYTVVFQLGYYPISIAAGIVMQFLAPIYYQRAGDASNIQRNANVYRLSWRLTVLVLCVTGAAFFIAMLFHAQIFRIIVAKEYALVSHLLPWVILAGGIFSAGQNIALNLMSQMKTQSMMGVKVTTALLGSILNFAGVYWYGITGIVIASILFSVLYFLWILVLSKKNRAEK
jgi:O-antigen/teichoic acid export membrane protein